MNRTFRVLILVAACVLLGASTADAAPPYRGSYPHPVYRPVTPIPPAIRVFPQVNTSPYYNYPSLWNSTPYWNAGYTYYPGIYRYTYSPYWGYNYFYTNPTYSSWYRRW